MSPLLVLGLKGLIGGSAVVAFALLGEMVRPRGLAGIFGGAPSVALASLGVTLLASGVLASFNESLGMMAGAAAFVLWCLLGAESVKRFGALKGSIASTAIWFVAALSLWGVALR